MARAKTSGVRAFTSALDVTTPRRSKLTAVPDEFLVMCPFCGEQVEIYVEPDVTGSFVQDCEVCCNPWRVHVSGRDEDRTVDVTRADGSD